MFLKEYSTIPDVYSHLSLKGGDRLVVVSTVSPPLSLSLSLNDCTFSDTSWHIPIVTCFVILTVFTNLVK